MTCYFLYTQQKCNGAPVCDKLDTVLRLLMSNLSFLSNRFSICCNTAYGGNDGGKVLSQYYLIASLKSCCYKGSLPGGPIGATTCSHYIVFMLGIHLRRVSPVYVRKTPLKINLKKAIYCGGVVF